LQIKDVESRSRPFKVVEIYILEYTRNAVPMLAYSYFSPPPRSFIGEGKIGLKRRRHV